LEIDKKRGRDESHSTKEQDTKKPKAHENGHISIQHLDLVGDFVTIINTGLDTVDISEWKLKSLVGSQSFSFPKGTPLNAGCSVTVWSGPHSETKGHPPSSFHWTKKSIWNDKGDSAELLNAEGKSVSKKEEKPPKYEASMAIQKLDLIGDFVTIVNKGSKDQDLTNWFIKSIIGSQRFVFPKGTVLKCGTTISVWSGKEADKRQNPPTSYFWTKKFIWNNDGDSCALYNAEGDVVSSHSEFPVTIASHVAPPKSE